MNSTSEKLSNFGETLREAGPYAVRFAFVAFVCAMAFAIFNMGETFGQPEPMRLLVAAGCAVGIFGHGVAMTVTKGGTNAGRMMHAIALGTWLLLGLFLASLYAFISSERLARFVPAGMADIGAVIYALAFGIGLFTSVLTLAVPAVAARPINDAKLPTLGSAVARFGEPLFIILCIGASALHMYEFGMYVAKVGMFATIAAMVVADLAFIVAEKRVLHELRERHDEGRFDKFDLVAWGIFGLLVLAYLVVVNIFSVRYSAGTLDMSDPMLRSVVDFYGASPTILILCAAALALVTAFVDIRDDEDDDRPTLTRLADRINAEREGFRSLRNAISSPKPAQRPAIAQNAKDGDAAQVRYKLPPGDPENLHKETDRVCVICGKPMKGKGRAKQHPSCGKKAEYERRKARMAEKRAGGE